jgi:hypothetical protein
MSYDSESLWRTIHSLEPATREDVYRLLVDMALADSGFPEPGFLRQARTMEERFQWWSHASDNFFSPEMIALATATAIFSKSFLETLGKRVGDGVANLPKRVGDLVRTYISKKGKPDESTPTLDEFHVGAGEAAAIIVITEALPDEARLALLDLDVTGDEVRGRLLRWDATAGTWLPDKDDEADPGK